MDIRSFFTSHSLAALGFFCLLLLSAWPSLAQQQAVPDALSQYRLGSGDQIKITVFGQDDLTLATTLSNIGNINYPFLGELQLIGLTVGEAEAIIDKGLRGDYLVNPSVSVTVVQYRPFFIDGAVKKPGGFPYQPGLSVSKAAALAGGFTERAAKANILIVRKIQGREIEIKANETDIVLPGDIVTVQETFF